MAEISKRIEALQIEDQKLSRREDEIAEEWAKPKTLNGAAAWAAGAENSPQTMNGATAREELQTIQKRRTFIAEALTEGKRELERARGQVSLKVCKEKLRPVVIENVTKILQALRQISDANKAIEQARNKFASDGIRTDSIPFCIFDIGGNWDDPHGGRVVGYRESVRGSFPEIENKSK